MNEKETVDYIQLLDEALELLLEKKKCMNIMLTATGGKKERTCLKRVEELEVLLEENSRRLKNFDSLKKPVIREVY